MNEANARQKELENTKSKVLVELRQLVYQCDQTMKAVSCDHTCIVTSYSRIMASQSHYLLTFKLNQSNIVVIACSAVADAKRGKNARDLIPSLVSIDLL